jgi:hypothetical protein
VSGSLFRLPAGIKPAIGGMVLGTLLSVPVGVFMHGLERGLVSQDQRDEIRKRKYDQYRLRQLQWESRLGSTARLIEGLEQELENPGSQPLSSTCETEQMTSTAKDDVQS